MKLIPLVEEKLANFEGSVAWYTITIRIDLEARNSITHDRTSKDKYVFLSKK